MTETSGMRVTRPWPNADWETVWRNLQEAPASEATKATWYRVIHDIVPTLERLHKIRMVLTDLCRHCNLTDALRRLTECMGRVNNMWVDKTANSDNTKNGSEANTRSMATTPRPQIVAPETSPRCIMGAQKLRNIPSATVTNTNATWPFRLFATRNGRYYELPGYMRGKLSTYRYNGHTTREWSIREHIKVQDKWLWSQQGDAIEMVPDHPEASLHDQFDITSIPK